MRSVAPMLLAALVGCGSCSDGERHEATPEERPDTRDVADEIARPDVEIVELPRAETATDPLDPSPALGVHANAITFGGDMFRVTLDEGRLRDQAELAGLGSVLASLRASAGGSEGRFRSALSLRADREARWDTVRAVTDTAAGEGFLEMRVVARSGDDDLPRQLRVRAERDDTEPHLRAHLDATGVDIRAPGLAAALEGACGEVPEGPLRIEQADVGWTWEALEECERTALTEITAETPAAGVTAEDDVRWERAVHVLDRLRALREDPERLALLLE